MGLKLNVKSRIGTGLGKAEAVCQNKYSFQQIQHIRIGLA